MHKALNTRAHAPVGFRKEIEMKRAILFIAACALLSTAAAQNYVKPHVRKDGTYVEGHVRSAPDNSQYNNYGSKGNVNPYNGQIGTVEPVYKPQPYQSPSYGQNCRYNSVGSYVCK